MKNKIKFYRESAGLTQEELGKLVGVSRQAIHAIETGKYEPSIWLAYDIAQVFHAAIEELFLFEESERKSRAEFSRKERHNGDSGDSDI